MTDNKDVKWFVAKTRAKQEKAICQQITDVGVEVFLPLRKELKVWRNRKKKVETVLIPNTVFIHACKSEAVGLHNDMGIKISFLRDITGLNKNQLMVIPDAQMDNFIRFIEVDEEEYEVEEDALYMSGDRVMVNKGPFKGIVGDLVRLDRKNKVLVRLDNLIACSVQVSLDDIEKINENI